MSKIKEECIRSGPKQVIEKISMQAGGVLGASDPGKLPRNEKQVQNSRRKVSNVSSEDHLFSIMQEVHIQDPEHSFVRDVKAAPEPAVVLASNQQLEDMLRFCISPQDFCILTIDPTFSLGDFDVTVITYRHLFLESRRGRNAPIMLGPLLVHYKKSFASYLFFASSLIGISPQLEMVCAFGTGGE
jgi:hypothetical protein